MGLPEGLKKEDIEAALGFPLAVGVRIKIVPEAFDHPNAGQTRCSWNFDGIPDPAFDFVTTTEFARSHQSRGHPALKYDGVKWVED